MKYALGVGCSICSWSACSSLVLTCPLFVSISMDNGLIPVCVFGWVVLYWGARVEVDIRSSVFAADLGIWQPWYDYLYAVDTPWNAWPSLHIVQSLLAVLVVSRWYNTENYRWQIRILWFAWLMLTISVMTTKQHFVWDVVTGIIIAVLAWKYWISPCLENCSSQLIVNEFETL